MGTALLTDVRGYFGGMDATGQNNSVQFSHSGVDLDKTTMGSGGWTETAIGLLSGKLTYSGFAAYGSTPGLAAADDEYWADLVAGVSVPVTLVPTSGAAGSVALVGQLLDTEYKRFDKVGALDPFELTAVTNGPLAKGVILNPTGTARTTTGVGTGFQLPAVSATQHAYMTFHALSITGTAPTLSVIVQSAAANTFASPTTRATFAGVTTQVGGQFAVAAGAITDTWWRVSFTLAGTSPSYLFACSVGII